MKFIKVYNNLIWYMTYLIMSKLTLLYILERFWSKIHIGHLWNLAFFMIILMILIKNFSNPFRRLVKLFSFNTLYLARMVKRWLISIFIIAFLIVSRRVIGLILVILHCQSIGLGIGYTVVHKKNAKSKFLALKTYNSLTTSARTMILYLF